MNGRTVDTYGDGARHVYYARFKLPFPLSNRDFVWYNCDIVESLESSSTTSTESEGPAKKRAYAIGISIHHPDVAEKEKGFVRGDIMTSGYLMEPGDEDPVNTTKLSYVVQVDIKGIVPTWITNLVAADQALNVARVINHFVKLNKEAEGKK